MKTNVLSSLLLCNLAIAVAGTDAFAQVTRGRPDNRVPAPPAAPATPALAPLAPAPPPAWTPGGAEELAASSGFAAAAALIWRVTNDPKPSSWCWLKVSAICLSNMS